MDVADKWVETVRDLKDATRAEGGEAYDVECLCRDILRYVRRSRIRDVGRFKQRTGLEYEAFIKSLASYDEAFVTRIVADDEFWEATMEMVRK
jgi:hypothetical protein